MEGLARTPAPALAALPPGKKGPAALEALGVGLAVGSLRCPCRLHNNRRHLHQLQWGLAVLECLT